MKALKEEGKWACEKLKESLWDWEIENTGESGIKGVYLHVDEKKQSKRHRMKIWETEI